MQVSTSLAAIERVCPRCRGRMLLVFRGPDHVATVEMTGAHTARMRESLDRSGLFPNEVELLMTVAELMAS